MNDGWQILVNKRQQHTMCFCHKYLQLVVWQQLWRLEFTRFIRTLIKNTMKRVISFQYIYINTFHKMHYLNQYKWQSTDIGNLSTFPLRIIREWYVLHYIKYVSVTTVNVNHVMVLMHIFYEFLANKPMTKRKHTRYDIMHKTDKSVNNIRWGSHITKDNVCILEWTDYTVASEQA